MSVCNSGESSTKKHRSSLVTSQVSGIVNTNKADSTPLCGTAEMEAGSTSERVVSAGLNNSKDGTGVSDSYPSVLVNTELALAL